MALNGLALEVLLVGQPLLPVLATSIGLPSLPKGAVHVDVMQRLHSLAETLRLPSLHDHWQRRCLCWDEEIPPADCSGDCRRSELLIMVVC